MSNSETIGKTDAARCNEGGHKLVTVKCMCGIRTKALRNDGPDRVVKCWIEIGPQRKTKGRTQ